MASQLQPLDLKWPVKGMQPDVPPSELPPGHASWIENAVVSPTDVTTRWGMRRVWEYGSKTLVPYGESVVDVQNGAIVTMQYGLPPGPANVDPVLADPPGTVPLVTPPGPANTTRIVNGTSYDNRSPTEFGETDQGRYAPMWSIQHGPFRVWTDPTTSKYLYVWAGAAASMFARPPLYALSGALNPGATTGTLSASPPQNFADWIVVVDRDAAGNNTANNGMSGNGNYAYHVVAGGGGGATFTLDPLTPYGHGDPSATALASGTNLRFYPVVTVQTPALAIASMASHQNRLFVGARGAIYWTYPGNNPSRWPQSNYAMLPMGRITGLASCPSGLLVFSESSMGLLSGTDESNYRFRIVDGGVGCSNQASICEYSGMVFWECSKGVYMWNGQRAEWISQGIESAVRAHERSALSYTSYNTVPTPRISAYQNRLYYTRVHPGTSKPGQTVPPTWVYDLTTGTWAAITAGQNTLCPIIYRSDGTFLRGYTQNAILDCSQFFREHPWRATTQTDVDEGYTYNTTTPTTSAIQGRIEFYVRPANRDTVRVRDMEVHHSAYYGGATSEPRTPWSVAVYPESPGNTATTQPVEARFVAGASTFDATKYFSDRHRDTTVGEGVGFVVRLNLLPVSTSLATPTMSKRVLNIRLYFDQTTTHQGRVNAAPTY